VVFSGIGSFLVREADIVVLFFFDQGDFIVVSYGALFPTSFLAKMIWEESKDAKNESDPYLRYSRTDIEKCW
jgi:hypothetical protein